MFIVLAAGEQPPDELVYETYVERGSLREGAWRVSLGRFTGDGFPLWPGETVLFETRVPPASSLRFAAAAAACSPYAGSEVVRLRFEVELDGERIGEQELIVGNRPRRVRCEIPLPAQGAERARLTFRLHGPAAVAAVLEPVLGPTDPASVPPERPERPDILLFLADTFRADLMETYGGEPGLTPTLDELASRSRVFERAWSVASWTLPSQASMLSGIYPYEHGATDKTRALPQAVRTVAEHMRRFGYRTGAITDSLYISRRYGLDQGFAWFDEDWQDLDHTLERVRSFLDSGDGRPTFLFVQTYRTHSPYHASEPARAAVGGDPPLTGDWDSIHGRLVANPWGWEPGAPRPDGMERVLADFERLYRAGAADLDRGFATLLQDLEQRGFLERGFLVFTSDHGEAFGEHDVLSHGNSVHEEELRVPLFVHGPGIAPGSVSEAVSTVDLALTIADLADVAPAPTWKGRSILRLAEDRPVYSFRCGGSLGQEWAIVEGARKWIAPRPPGPNAPLETMPGDVYDLTTDPYETSPATANESRAHDPLQTWSRALRRKRSAELRRLFQPAHPADRVHLDAEEADRMRAMGYTGS